MERRAIAFLKNVRSGLAANERARVQWQLERAFAEFERKF